MHWFLSKSENVKGLLDYEEREDWLMVVEREKKEKKNSKLDLVEGPPANIKVRRVSMAETSGYF